MKTSQNGLFLIKSYEGLRLAPYLCSAGVATIGYGSTCYKDGSRVKITDAAISAEQAETLFADTLAPYENCVDAISENLGQNQFDALVSLAYNIGCDAFSSSTLAKLIRGNQLQAAALAFASWNKARTKTGLKVVQGLVLRRAAEQKLFEKS